MVSRHWLLGFVVALSWVGCGGRYSTEEGAGGSSIGSGGSGGAYPNTGGAYPNTGGAYPNTGGAYPNSGGAYPSTGGFAGFAGAISCGKGFANCNGACVNLYSDPYNCGACGNYCPNGFCGKGFCQPQCGPEQAFCNGVCIDILNDPGNCGGCFNVCAPDSFCSGGLCMPICGDGRVNCGAACVDPYTDPYNCGGCGIQCGPSTICDQGMCRNPGQVFSFSGIRKNLPQATLAGWQQCHAEPYGSNGMALTAIQSKCYKSRLLLACREAGSNLLLLAANAPRADVLYQNPASVVHNANNVGWYYSSSRSWGFAPASATVQLSTCDIESVDGDKRLCWHTTNGGMQGGWRCGLKTDLNNDMSFERVIFHAD